MRSRKSAPAPFLVYLLHKPCFACRCSVSALHCKKLLNIKHVLPQTQSCRGGKKKKKKGSGREEVGKLLRRQVPPLFDALMLIHSERTSCLSAYAESPLCFFFSVCGAPLCFLFLSCFLSSSFFFCLLPSVDSPSTPRWAVLLSPLADV